MQNNKVNPLRRLRALMRRIVDGLIHWLKSPSGTPLRRRDHPEVPPHGVRPERTEDFVATGAPESRPASDLRHEPIRTTGRARASSGRLQLLPWVTPARDYLVLSPPRPADDLKLMVMLHGCRQKPDGFARAARLEALVMRGDWVVLLPAQSSRANLHGCWNWFDTRSVVGAGETAIIVAAVEQVARQFDISPAATFIAGMSSGAAIAASAVCHRPDRFAGAAFHSGVGMGATSSALRARTVLRDGPDRDITRGLLVNGDISVLVIHGDQDEVVTPRHADELMRQMLTLNGQLPAGAPLPAPERVEAHWEPASRDSTTRSGSEVVEPDSIDPGRHPGKPIQVRHFGRHRHVTVRNLGHAWSGGLANEPFFDASAPDACDWISDFFTARARSVQTADS